MARVTYGLVGAALIALLLGIFVLDNTNTLLFVSIGLSIACIAMVIFGAARRARETPDSIVAPDPDFATIQADSDDADDSTAVLSAFEDADEEGDYEDEDEEADEEEFVDEDDEDEELDEDDEDDEDDDFYEEDDEDEDEDDGTEVIAIPSRSSKKKPASRKPAAKKTAAKKSTSKAKPAAKKSAAKAKPAAKTAAKKTTAKKAAKAKPAASSGKVVVVPGRDRFHKASCRFVKGKDDAESITLSAAKRGGYEACSVCKP